jgi:hypothetical protein
MKRYWKIEVPDGQRLKLEWSYLNLEHQKQCKRDSVIIKDSPRSRTSTSFCGYELPLTYLTPGNKVIVVFQSDERNVGTGFKIHYQAVPGKISKQHFKVLLVGTVCHSDTLMVHVPLTCEILVWFL